jgi:membrane dipeptidase
MDRRHFLTSVGASVALAGADRAAEPSRPAAPPKTYRVIDTHLHLFNTRLEGTKGIPRYIQKDATVEAALVAMDRGGVAKAFLISYGAQDVGVQVRLRGVDPAAIQDVVNKEYQVDAWKAHKDRFWWFTDHIDPARPGYLDDLRRDFDTGAAGVKLLPWFHGFLADHPGFLRVFELCRERCKPIIIDLSWWYFHLQPLARETTVRRKLVKSFADYARLLDPVFRHLADVPFSLAHAGTARTTADYDAIFALIADHANVSCDVAAATDYSAPFLQRLVRAVGAHKVMYGTDWPYWSSGPESYRVGERRWRLIADECPFSPEDKQQILAGNAERFVRNELPLDALGQKAHALHQASTVVVIHDHRPIVPDVALMQAGGVTAKVYQLGVDVDIGADFRASAPLRQGWAQKTCAALDDARRTIEADPKRLLLALTAEDIRRAKREGKVAIVLGVEGGKLLEGDLDRLREFHRLGLRELQLRWAVPNQLVEIDALTDFGTAVLRECQRLGVVVDLTHIPEKAFHQAVALATKPLIVSHGTGRELGAARVAAIKRLRGVIGIHFYSSYLGARPTVGRVVDAVDDLVRQAGMEVVGLGVDLFPTDGPWRDFQRAQGTSDVSWAIPDLGHLEEVTRALVVRGYTDAQIQAILGGNFLRVCQEVFGR